MAGFPQASDLMWASGFRKNDDADIDAAGNAQSLPRQPELLQFYRPQPDTAGDFRRLSVWLAMGPNQSPSPVARGDASWCDV